MYVFVIVMCGKHVLVLQFTAVPYCKYSGVFQCSIIFFVFAGIPIRTNLDNSTTVSYSSIIRQLVGQSTTVVRDLDPTVSSRMILLLSSEL